MVWFGGARRRTGCVEISDTWDLGGTAAGWRDSALKVVVKSVSARLKGRGLLQLLLHRSSGRMCEVLHRVVAPPVDSTSAAEVGEAS